MDLATDQDASGARVGVAIIPFRDHDALSQRDEGPRIGTPEEFGDGNARALPGDVGGPRQIENRQRPWTRRRGNAPRRKERADIRRLSQPEREEQQRVGQIQNPRGHPRKRRADEGCGRAGRESAFPSRHARSSTVRADKSAAVVRACYAPLLRRSATIVKAAHVIAAK